jgi:hypothetical protein
MSSLVLSFFSAFNPRKNENKQVSDTMEGADNYDKETNQQYRTAFRQWTAPVEGNTLQDAPIPGLREALINAGLSSFIISIERWCRKKGVACLSDVVDAMESICSDFGPLGSDGLTPELRKRLSRALSSQSTSEARNSSNSQDSIENFVASIRDKLPAAKSVQRACDHILPGESHGRRVGLYPGLKNAFEQAGLSHLSDTAETWCHDNGAVFLQETLDNFDDLCEDLSPPDSGCLDTEVRERLKGTLSSQIALESGMLLGGNMTRKAKTW